LDGRSTGGVINRPPVLKPLSAKVFRKKTGGGEVKSISKKKTAISLSESSKAKDR
jgi:hypothetical protein